MPSAKTVAAPSHRDPALDGIRGLAVLLVFFYHYGGGLKSHTPIIHLCGVLCSCGWIGVPIFFVLSGFLITNILWDTQQRQHRVPHRLRNFYVRRVLRIFPLYYFSLALAVICLLVVGGSVRDIHYFAPEAFFLLDIPHISHASAIASPLPLFHFWTLAVEEQFYLLWPLLLLCCRNRRAAIYLCLATFSSSFAFCVAVNAFPSIVSPTTAASLNEFLLTNAGVLALGGLLALLTQPVSSHRGKTVAPLPCLPSLSPETRQPTTSGHISRFGSIIFLLGIAIFVTASLYHHTFKLDVRGQVFTALPAIWLSSAALIALVLHTGRLRVFFSNITLRFFGRISYAFYVFHILFKPLYDGIARHLTLSDTSYTYLLTRFSTAFLLTLAISWLSFHLLESPFLNLKRHFPLYSTS